MLGCGFVNSAGVSGISGVGEIDGDSSGLWDSLEFGPALGAQPATALIGGVKSVNADGSTALDTLGANSVTILSEATTSTKGGIGERSVAVGSDVWANDRGGVSIGDGVVNQGLATVAIGGGDGTLTGPNANASADRAVVIGVGAIAQGDSIVSIGRETGATGISSSESVFVGDQAGKADANTERVVLVGHSTNSNSSFGVAVGAEATTDNQCVSIGFSTRAIDTFSIAIGAASDATKQASIAIGGDSSLGAQATAEGAIAIGGDDGEANAAVAQATAIRAIQVGVGTNSTATSFQVGSATVPYEIFLNLPTSAGTTGSLWNDSGTVKVA